MGLAIGHWYCAIGKWQYTIEGGLISYEMAIYRVQQCVFHQIEYNDMFFTLFAGELAWWYKDLTTHSTHTRGSHNGHPITAHQSHFHEKSVFRAVKSNTHTILFARQKLSKNSATILFWMEEQGVANIFQTNKSGGKKHSSIPNWLTGKFEKLPNSLYFIYYVNNL